MELDNMVGLKDIKIDLPAFELVLRPIVKQMSTPKEDTIEKTTTPFNLMGNIKIISKSEGDRIIAGYANVAVVDLDEQFIPIETLKKGMETLLEDPHYSNLMIVHKNIQIGKIIPEYGQLTTHVDDKGLFIVAEIRKDIETANQVWESILAGEINGFSIGCEVINDHKQCDDDKCITVLDEINIFEVSVCTKPINEKSGFVVVSKSQVDNVCDNCNINDEIMTKIDEPKVEEKSEEPKEEKAEEVVKETKQEESEETKSETEEKSVEDRISQIEREILSLTETIQSLIEVEGKAEPNKEDEEEPEEEEKAEPEAVVEKQTEEEQDEEDDEEDEENEEEMTKKSDFEELKDSIDKLTKSIDGLLNQEELKLSIKARDDQIEALKAENKVKIVEKAKVEVDKKPEPKTVHEKSEPTEEMEYEIDYVYKRGEFYKKP